MRSTCTIARRALRGTRLYGSPAGSISKTFSGADAAALAGITGLGIKNVGTVHRNLSYPELQAHEAQNKEGIFSSQNNTFAVDTGIFTGRSPKDKWIVQNIGSESDQNMWWGKVNQPMKPEIFDELYEKAISHYNSLDKCYG